MSADKLTMSPNCRECGGKLSIDEMHYYDHGDGTASCNKCEGEWSNAVDAWRRGDIQKLPERP